MKTLIYSMCILVAGCALAPLLMSCHPAPAYSTLAQDWAKDRAEMLIPLKTCDEKGVCCYVSPTAKWSISCVATRVEISIKHEPEFKGGGLHYQCGDYDNRGEPVWYDCGPSIDIPGVIEDDNKSQGNSQVGGEIQNRTLETRLLLREPGFRGN